MNASAFHSLLVAVVAIKGYYPRRAMRNYASSKMFVVEINDRSVATFYRGTSGLGQPLCMNGRLFRKINSGMSFQTFNN